MNKERKKYIQSCEVSRLETLKLGGYDQKVLIEGKSKALPVVIFLHGGPGTPVPFSVGCRGLFPELTQKVIAVYWDQLGCGINNRKLDESFTVDSFVDMTCDLIEEVKKAFPQNKIYIFAISWGSVLALKSAVRVHEKLEGVFVYGQVIKNLFFNDYVKNAFDCAPSKIKKTVEKIFADGTDCGDKILDKNLARLASLLRKHTNGYVNKNSRQPKSGDVIKGLLTSPDYKFKDFKAIINNGYKGLISLWRELFKIDLTNEFSGLEIPYTVMQGDTDLATPTPIAEEVLGSCTNKNVKFEILKDSGHMPSESAMDYIFEVVSNL